MKVLSLVLFLCGVGLTAALPASSRSQEPDDCSKECINGVIQYGQDLSILKHSDLTNYFNKIEQVCEVITTARKCLDTCGTTNSNPFALESLNIVCQPDTQEKINSIKQCLHYIDTNVNEICTKECGNDHIIDETDVTPKMNPIIQKANSDCATFKCMARCNIEVVSNQCGKELGKEFQSLLQEVSDAQRKDLEGLQLIDTMAKTSPPECNYLYDPTVLFGSSKSEEPSTSEAEVKHDPKEDAKSLYAQAQLQLLLKQLELAEKQDQLIDRENAKLDMEMSYMAHKAEKRFHAQQQQPTFMPMESAHPHQESMPSEAHPPMEDNHHEEPSHPEHAEQMPMESHPSMPTEENHAQSMPAMEPQQPSMPMEHQHQQQPSMDFPHPDSMSHGMPMEMIPEQPRYKMPRRSMPSIVAEGVPMEFVPFNGAPIELPMHYSMEAMPRFL